MGKRTDLPVSIVMNNQGNIEITVKLTPGGTLDPHGNCSIYDDGKTTYLVVHAEDDNGRNTKIPISQDSYKVIAAHLTRFNLYGYDPGKHHHAWQDIVDAVARVVGKFSKKSKENIRVLLQDRGVTTPVNPRTIPL